MGTEQRGYRLTLVAQMDQPVSWSKGQKLLGARPHAIKLHSQCIHVPGLRATAACCRPCRQNLPSRTQFRVTFILQAASAPLLCRVQLQTSNSTTTTRACGTPSAHHAPGGAFCWDLIHHTPLDKSAHKQGQPKPRHTLAN
jgi:hypothetical protein